MLLRTVALVLALAGCSKVVNFDDTAVTANTVAAAPITAKTLFDISNKAIDTVRTWRVADDSAYDYEKWKTLAPKGRGRARSPITFLKALTDGAPASDLELPTDVTWSGPLVQLTRAAYMNYYRETITLFEQQLDRELQRAKLFNYQARVEEVARENTERPYRVYQLRIGFLSPFTFDEFVARLREFGATRTHVDERLTDAVHHDLYEAYLEAVDQDIVPRRGVPQVTRFPFAPDDRNSAPTHEEIRNALQRLGWAPEIARQHVGELYSMRAQGIALANADYRFAVTAGGIFVVSREASDALLHGGDTRFDWDAEIRFGGGYRGWPTTTDHLGSPSSDLRALSWGGFRYRNGAVTHMIDRGVFDKNDTYRVPARFFLKHLLNLGGADIRETR